MVASRRGAGEETDSLLSPPRNQSPETSDPQNCQVINLHACEVVCHRSEGNRRETLIRPRSSGGGGSSGTVWLHLGTRMMQPVSIL